MESNVFATACYPHINIHMAIRALAFKWIRILWRYWQYHKPCDEAKYLMALRDKGSLPIKELAS